VAKTHTWQRTAKHFRDLGYRVVKTEHSSRGIRHDLMGFVDGIAFGIGECLYLQACGGSDFAEHRRKILGPCRRDVERVLMAGNRVLVVGWRKVGPRGKRKTWQPRIEEITLEDLVNS
jgi:hypothetical protein